MWLTKTSVNKSFNLTSNIFYWFELFSFLQIWAFLKIQLPLDEGRPSRWNSEVVHPNLNYFWVVIFQVSHFLLWIWTKSALLNNLIVDSLARDHKFRIKIDAILHLKWSRDKMQFWFTSKLFECSVLVRIRCKTLGEKCKFSMLFQPRIRKSFQHLFGPKIGSPHKVGEKIK